MPDFRSDAAAHALEVFPQESCGLIVDGHYWRCRNVCDEPTEHFVLDPRDYLNAYRSGQIQAIVHSHPKGGPASGLDLKACSQSKLVWHIYQVPQQQWLIINP